jgi:transposase-like protein
MECEHCGAPMVQTDGGEMTGAARRYRCDDCRVTVHQDASGLAVEEIEPPR